MFYLSYPTNRPTVRIRHELFRLIITSSSIGQKRVRLKWGRPEKWARKLFRRMRSERIQGKDCALSPLGPRRLRGAEFRSWGQYPRGMHAGFNRLFNESR